MRHDFTLIALIGLAFGVRDFFEYLGRRRPSENEAIENWETEGGAVPVAPNRTAAEVWPHPAP
jgi:hypothetical protein